MDVEGQDQATGTVSCMPGYVVTDGSGRIDHVDQGTGTFADVHMTENRAIGNDSWRATFVNDAFGRVQAKVFAVCVKSESESINGHDHHIVVGPQISETHALPDRAHRRHDQLCRRPGADPAGLPARRHGSGAHDVPVRRRTAGRSAWSTTAAPPSATFTMRCLDILVSTANGHTHALGLDGIYKTVTVPAGQTVRVHAHLRRRRQGHRGGLRPGPGPDQPGQRPAADHPGVQVLQPDDRPADRPVCTCSASRTAPRAGPTAAGTS